MVARAVTHETMNTDMSIIEASPYILIHTHRLHETGHTGHIIITVKQLHSYSNCNITYIAMYFVIIVTSHL